MPSTNQRFHFKSNVKQCCLSSLALDIFLIISFTFTGTRIFSQRTRNPKISRNKRLVKSLLLVWSPHPWFETDRGSHLQIEIDNFFSEHKIKYLYVWLVWSFNVIALASQSQAFMIVIMGRLSMDMKSKES